MKNDSTIIRIASQQGGLIRRDQATNVGLTEDQIDWRVSTGAWELVTNGGYRLLDLPGREHLVRAAIAILPDATVSHFSAAAFHDLTSVSTKAVSVTVASKTTHAFLDVRVFRNNDLAPWHRVEIAGLPATTLERTVIDLASVLSKRHMQFVVGDLLNARRCDVTGLTAVLDSVARRGKPGVGSMRSILDGESTRDANETPLEQAGNALLVRAGFTNLAKEYPIPWMPLKRFDIAFVAERIAIEWDSRRWHMLKDAFESDRQRDRLAMEYGWRVVRFTWRDVHDNPASVVETVRAILGAGQPV
jgi:hypothetical protein